MALPLPLPFLTVQAYVGLTPPQDVPRLTSDGGSAKDDAALNRDLPAGGGGSGAPIASARARALNDSQRSLLAEKSKKFSQEYVLALERAMLDGKDTAEAEREASRLTGE